MKRCLYGSILLLCLAVICGSVSSCSNAKPSAADEEIAKLKTELAARTAELGQCRAELAEVKEQNTALSGELEASKNAATELEQTVKELSKECVSFKNDIEMLAQYLSGGKFDLPVYITKDDIKIPDEHKNLIKKEFSAFVDVIKTDSNTNTDYPVVMLLLDATLIQYSAEKKEYTYELGFLYSVSDKNCDDSTYYGSWDGIRGDYKVFIKKVDGKWVSSAEGGE